MCIERALASLLLTLNQHFPTRVGESCSRAFCIKQTAFCIKQTFPKWSKGKFIYRISFQYLKLEGVQELSDLSLNMESPLTYSVQDRNSFSTFTRFSKKLTLLNTNILGNCHFYFQKFGISGVVIQNFRKLMLTDFLF